MAPAPAPYAYTEYPYYASYPSYYSYPYYSSPYYTYGPSVGVAVGGYWGSEHYGGRGYDYHHHGWR
ncbi:MAG: hypothetical protein JO089_09020 [Alphaproteobacteria bacterium]|nr:hypothetical protein [Alphaproteobacteria bacterium]